MMENGCIGMPYQAASETICCIAIQSVDTVRIQNIPSRRTPRSFTVSELLREGGFTPPESSTVSLLLLKGSPFDTAGGADACPQADRAGAETLRAGRRHQLRPRGGHRPRHGRGADRQARHHSAIGEGPQRHRGTARPGTRCMSARRAGIGLPGIQAAPDYGGHTPSGCGNGAGCRPRNADRSPRSRTASSSTTIRPRRCKPPLAKPRAAAPSSRMNWPACSNSPATGSRAADRPRLLPLRLRGQGLPGAPDQP
jgi:hypothetical protein